MATAGADAPVLDGEPTMDLGLSGARRGHRRRIEHRTRHSALVRRGASTDQRRISSAHGSRRGRVRALWRTLFYEAIVANQVRPGHRSYAHPESPQLARRVVGSVGRTLLDAIFEESDNYCGRGSPALAGISTHRKGMRAPRRATSPMTNWADTPSRSTGRQPRPLVVSSDRC